MLTPSRRTARGAILVALCALLLLLGSYACGRSGADSGSPGGEPEPGSSMVPVPSASDQTVATPQGVQVTVSVMVNVPAGEFFMGASPRDKDADEDEKGRSVRLPAFQIAKYEVTNAQYARFVESTGHVGDDDWREYARKWGERAPVVYVSWDDANAYCRWAGLRLPTEAEWERAARGTDRRIYPWGDNWDASRAVFDSDGAKPVGSVPSGVSPAGCLDMAGNVVEWTDDWYDPEQTDKVVRGGGWLTDIPGVLRCSHRNMYSRGYRSSNLGFRCARTP